MAFIRKFAVATSVLLLVSTACAATGLAQDEPAPATPTPATTAQPAPGTAVPGQAATTSVPTSPAPATIQMPDGEVLPLPGSVNMPATGTPAGGAYVPRTEHDNTPWRFNMQQDGQSMSADKFDEWMKSKGVRVATGKPATPLVQNCPTPEGDKGDSDGDGIINCLDLCPASEAGQTIGPDGCPVPVSIDLKGVTFAYDKATLGDEAKAVLSEALEILQRYPDLKVEVAGHTDSRGDAKYNQALSERRAKAVYDYLVENGIDKARLIGPVGFGEMRPLVPNQKPDGSDDPEGRAKNRRTELNIQN